ncbi:MAG TPA: hypothetical protein VHO25_21700, partial [Polyangiaceae bacterium]|nr:hypothetical protein [Polyangiaceae bacterium]
MHSGSHRFVRYAVALGGLLLSAVAARPAAAQAEFRVPSGYGDGADTHLFRPALDSKGFFTVNGTDILGANDISFGLVLDYGKNLLRTTDKSVPLAEGAVVGDGQFVPCADGLCPGGIAAGQTGRGDDALVPDSFQGTWAFNYGVANVAVVGITVPVVLMTGDENYNIGPAGGLGPYNTGVLDEQSISTIGLHGKLRLTRVEKGIGLAVSAQVGTPIG